MSDEKVQQKGRDIIGWVPVASLGFISAWALAALFFRQGIGWAPILFALSLVAAALILWKGDQPSLLRACCTPLVLASSLLIGLGIITVAAPGDAGTYVRVVQEGSVFPRWLGGTYLLSLFSGYFPQDLSNLSRLLAVLGALWFAFWIDQTLRSLPSSTALLVLVFSPLTLSFMGGHLEYYPIAAGPAIFLAFRFLNRGTFTGLSLLDGAVMAILPWFYLGFVPIWVALLFVMLDRGWRPFLIGSIGSLVTLGCLIEVSWSGGLWEYIPALHNALNLGSQNLPRQYQAIAGGAHSIYFSIESILSARRWWEISYLVFFGAGVVLPAYFIWMVVCGTSLVSAPQARDKSWTLLSLAALSLFYLHYLFFMIPRLGIRRDVDLFFVSYLAFMLLAHTVEGLLRTQEKNTVSRISSRLSLALFAFSIPLAIRLNF